MRTILIILTVGLLSCDGQKVLEKHNSPTGAFVLQVELDNSKPNDEHLGFRLLTKDGKELDYIRTFAGDHMKWAVTWFNDKIIILDSHDVGTYGWTVDNGRHKTMDQVAKDMENKCVEAFKIKYRTRHTTLAIKHMLYCRFFTCVLANFACNVGQRCRYLDAYVL